MSLPVGFFIRCVPNDNTKRFFNKMDQGLKQTADDVSRARGFGLESRDQARSREINNVLEKPGWTFEGVVCREYAHNADARARRQVVSILCSLFALVWLTASVV